MRILVTGGFGFIGSAFCEQIAKQGYELVILDKMTYAADTTNLSREILEKSSVLNVDLADEEAVDNALSNIGRLDWIVNFAAESHVDRSIKNGVVFAKSNVLGVVHLLEYVKKHPAVKFLQVLTDEVYGSALEGSWTEDSSLEPRSPYSSSKAAAELFCRSYVNTFDSNIWITRCANNFGPRQSAEKLIPTIINSVLNGTKIPVYGSGQNIREWIYVYDHVTSLMRLIEAEKTDFRVYNLGGVACSNLDMIRRVLKLMNASDDFISFVEDRPGHDFRYSVDDSRYRAEWGPIQTHDLSENLEMTVNWYLENQDWLKRSLERLKK